MRKVFPPSPPETPRSGLRPLRIRELGAAVGVEVETIRYYEKAGLLPSPVRSDNGYRAYGQEYVQRLAFIRHCRSLDMSLADVAQLLGLMDNPAADGAGVDALVQQQIARVRMRPRLPDRCCCSRRLRQEGRARTCTCSGTRGSPRRRSC